MLARLAVAVALCFSTAVFGQIKIGLMVSATGPTSAIGIPQKNTGEILPKQIAGVPVEYISLEDGGDTTRAVQNIKKLVQEDHIDALIGPSTTPNAFAILDVIAESKVPMMATVGTSAVVEPIDAKKRWVFKTTQNDDLIAAALLKHMSKNNIKTVAFIGFSDPYGDNWLKVFSALGEKAGVKVINAERFNRTDQSVTGQVLQMIAAKPDAMLIAAVGGSAVLRKRRYAIRDGKVRSTRPMRWRPTISSSSARRRSRGRCSPRARCWSSTISRTAIRSRKWR